MIYEPTATIGTSKVTCPTRRSNPCATVPYPCNKTEAPLEIFAGALDVSHSTVAAFPVTQVVAASGLIIRGTKTSCAALTTKFMGEAWAIKKRQNRTTRKEANVRAIIDEL